jgi:hypothetical protein
MNAELVLLGKRIDMAPRARRRMLVVLIYVGIGAAMTGFWFLDRWHTSSAYLILATIPINRFFLGGYNFGGLIKPFNGKAPRRNQTPPSSLSLVLRIYRPEPDEREYRNDEREADLSRQAHYRAYPVLSLAMIAMWLVTNFHANIPRLLTRLSIPVDPLLYGLTTASVVVAFTLPQAILLWTEPDMETEAEDPAA